MEDISIEGKEFLTKLLEYDPAMRPAAQTAVNDKWIKMYEDDNKYHENIVEALNSLANYNTHQTL